MKKIITLITIISSLCLIGQSPSTSPNDQVVQGPCFVFAFNAALEAKARVTGNAPSNIDFYEWNLWSECAIGSVTGTPEGVIPKLFQYAKIHGISEFDNQFIPTASQVPNKHGVVDGGLLNNATPKGFGYFFSNYNDICTTNDRVNYGTNWCQNNSWEPGNNNEGGYDECGKEFIFLPNNAAKWKLKTNSVDDSRPTLGDLDISGLTNQGKVDAIKSKLQDGQGVIAILSKWANGTHDEDSIRHGLYIFGSGLVTANGDASWQVKDSWPGDSGIGSNKFIPSWHLEKIYWLEGGEVENQTGCTKSISGSPAISNTTSYSLAGVGNPTSIEWIIPDGLEFTNGSTNTSSTIQVVPNGCYSGNETIFATYSLGSKSCSASIQVDIDIDTKYISGPNLIEENATFTLSGLGTADHIQWSLPFGTTLISGSLDSNSITVSSTGCYYHQGQSISVSYDNGNTTCTKYKEVIVGGGTPAPSGISVLSPDWVNGSTCPNTVLELEVPDPLPGRTYEWSISGATIQSGQNTPTVFVKTLSAPWTVYLTFKVRTKKPGCTPSAWTTIYGATDASPCGGGSGARVENEFTQENEIIDSNFRMFPNPIHENESFYIKGLIEDFYTIEISDLSGKMILLDEFSPEANEEIKIDASPFKKGIYIVKISSGNFYKTVKIIKE